MSLVALPAYVAAANSAAAERDNLSPKTRRAVAKYGRKACVDAYSIHQEGNGASTVGFYLNLTTQQADAAINAGREIAAKDNES